VTVQFRGREVSHAYLGRDLLVRFAEQIGDNGTVERQPLLEGKQMSLVITSNHKPKIQRREEAQNDAETAEAGETDKADEPEKTIPARAAPVASSGAGKPAGA
jgi:hypothetical protein